MTPLVLLLLLAGSAGAIRDYAAETAVATDETTARTVIALRALTRGGERLHWVVDPATVEARLVPASRLRLVPRPWPSIRSQIAGTAYGRALRAAEANAERLQDAGLDHVRPPRPGVDLTLDLCPPRRPLDRSLFASLIEALGREERPVPVAVAVTGAWLREHRTDLDWLVSLERDGALEVTWVNHSDHHRTSPTLPLASNFLLEPGTDVKAEVLGAEVAMLEAGLLPSVFFRFPGLVSRRGVFEQVVALGLVPLGSDAWLAKSRKPPGEGSIVLVHANGNEPTGVTRFLELLRSEDERIRAGRWQLLDLRESVVETETDRRTRE